MNLKCPPKCINQQKTATFRPPPKTGKKLAKKVSSVKLDNLANYAVPVVPTLHSVHLGLTRIENKIAKL